LTQNWKSELEVRIGSQNGMCKFYVLTLYRCGGVLVTDKQIDVRVLCLIAYILNYNIKLSKIEHGQYLDG
jgi:hypothetical protein